MSVSGMVMMMWVINRIWQCGVDKVCSHILLNMVVRCWFP